MLEERIYQDYLKALKTKDRLKIDFLSFVRSEFKNKTISLKKQALDDSEVLSLLKKEQKRLNDSRQNLIDSQRSDLLKNLEAELAILTQYLPEPLKDEKLLAIVKETITEEGAASLKDMGKVIKKVLEKVGAQAEAKKVSLLVKNSLSNS